MRVLVYGAGVIGSYLTHLLCLAGNDVTLLARGGWCSELRRNGLKIHHYIQRRTTIDYPFIVDHIDSSSYDVVFAAVQCQELWEILDDLVKANTKQIVLIGNNLSSSQMEQYILKKSNSRSVLFGFEGSAGRREVDYVESVHTGRVSFYIGGAHRGLNENERALFKELFHRVRIKLYFEDDMDGWYKSHMAFILPIVYLCYMTGCNLRLSTHSERRILFDAVNESFSLLRSLNIPIRPVGEDGYFRPGIKRALFAPIMFIITKTKLGELCASNHTRSAVSEMENLEQAWLELRSQTEYIPMPNWDHLFSSCPEWKILHSLYGNE